MLNILKKLFKKKEAKEEKIGINELESWFNGKASDMLKELDNKISIAKGKIKEEIKKTRENLGILEKAQLHNPKISLREKQFMEGNREAYIKRANIFLKQVSMEGSHRELLEFCSNFDTALDSFGKSTFRPYKILQEFLANESRDIAINVKNLDNLVKELKNTIRTAGLDSIESLKNDIIQLKNKLKQKEENEKELKEKEKEKGSIAQLINKIEEEISALEKSEENKRLNELKADREVILAKIREHNGKLIHSFSVTEKALKKYSRMVVENERLLNDYIENPAKALLNDNELKIIKILEGLEKNILSNQIDLIDKKREKTLEEVKNLNKGFFEGFLKKSKELEDELSKIEGKTKENTVEGKIDELRGNLEKKEMETEKTDKEIAMLKEDVDMNMEDLKRKLEEKIKNVLKIEIKII